MPDDTSVFAYGTETVEKKETLRSASDGILSSDQESVGTTDSEK